MCTPPNICFVRSTQKACGSVQPFLHSSQQTIPILYNVPPHFPSKLPLPLGIWTLSNTRFPGSNVSSPQPKRHLDRFSCFYIADECDRQTDRQTNRQTDHATPSVIIGRNVRSTAMRPNKNILIHLRAKNEKVIKIDYLRHKTKLMCFLYVVSRKCCHPFIYPPTDRKKQMNDRFTRDASIATRKQQTNGRQHNLTCWR